jgi:hypothetical protein
VNLGSLITFLPGGEYQRGILGVGRTAALQVALTQEVESPPAGRRGILGIRTRRITLMIVTDVYPGKDLGTLDLTSTVFWSCRVFSQRRAANQPILLART